MKNCNFKTLNCSLTEDSGDLNSLLEQIFLHSRKTISRSLLYKVKQSLLGEIEMWTPTFYKLFCGSITTGVNQDAWWREWCVRAEGRNGGMSKWHGKSIILWLLELDMNHLIRMTKLKSQIIHKKFCDILGPYGDVVMKQDEAASRWHFRAAVTGLSHISKQHHRHPYRSADHGNCWLGQP